MNIAPGGRVLAAALAFAAAGYALTAPAAAQSDASIKQRLIRESIASYTGSCPCPYSVDRAGNVCGDRSAYVRPGGASPICYPGDVSTDMVQRARGTR